MLVPRPPLDEQREIAAYLDDRMAALARVVAGIDSQIDTLIAYRKSLIHECVTGQRRVTESDLRAALDRPARLDGAGQREDAHA